MKVFLAGTNCRPFYAETFARMRFVLESFYHIKSWQIELIPKWQDFLLDSGAFTFMSNAKIKVDFESYLRKYIAFINQHNIRYFFELDIDSIVGLSEVERMRRVLETETGKKCIPVWHKGRGLQYFVDLTKAYKYIAIGGIATHKIAKRDWDIFIPMLKIAKQNHCRVHGLGFTATEALKKYNFYSVDSTSWLSGARFGNLHVFRHGSIQSTSRAGKRIRDYKVADLHNLQAWIKYQEYKYRGGK